MDILSIKLEPEDTFIWDGESNSISIRGRHETILEDAGNSVMATAESVSPCWVEESQNGFKEEEASDPSQEIGNCAVAKSDSVSSSWIEEIQIGLKKEKASDPFQEVDMQDSSSSRCRECQRLMSEWDRHDLCPTCRSCLKTTRCAICRNWKREWAWLERQALDKGKALAKKKTPKKGGQAHSSFGRRASARLSIGMEDAIVVTAVVDEDRFLAEKKENGLAFVSRNENSDLEEEGCQMSHSFIHPMPPAETSSSEDTYPQSSSSGWIPTEDLCTFQVGCPPQQLAKKLNTSSIYDPYKSVKCEFCEKSFSSEVAHNNHQKMHERTCQFCGKLWESKSKCKTHERTHTGEKPFTCQFQFCKRSFGTKEVCTAHERIHTGEKPFTCQFCKKSFRTKRICQDHEKIHTDEKPFKCQFHFCKKSFRTKNGHKVHGRTHTGERLPFQCQFCRKCFSSKSYCETHELLHTGKKPFECQFCWKFFTSKSSCTKHEITHTIPVGNPLSDSFVKNFMVLSAGFVRGLEKLESP